MTKFITAILILLVSFTSCAQVAFTEQNVAIDDSLNIAVIHIPKDASLSKTTAIPLENENYTLTLSKTKNLTTIAHKLKSASGKKYIAYLTTFPLFQIDAPNGIVNEPKRMSTIHYAEKDTTFTAYAGIELRGSSSIVFAKKTYDLNFYTDSTGTENLDVKLAGMRKDDDWILDGLYNEPLRMRSYISLNLWNDIYEPYYLDREPKAKAGATAKYAEVFVNGRYKGVFLLSEQVDRKLTKIKKMDEGDIIRGELFQGARYLGASSFDSVPKKKNFLASWGGYDIKYPVPTNQFWDNVHPFTDFVVNSDDDAFAKAISQKFYLPNAMDYFLYINAVRAPDNLGKNLYLIRYDDGEPYFYAPWDLDGSLGTIFSGKRIATTDDWLDNGLLRRLLATDAEGFVTKFKSRWIALRADQLSTERLLEKQAKTYRKLKDNLIFEREAKAWDNFKYDEEGLEYMQEWTTKRLEFLDGYIEKLNPKTD
ncbi:spore coat protein CotH [Dokdonia sinensis]|uniref:Spore coat protein CotH n=1 Tax=Dokdonia sinensis TaxID=2479847 RepID=A0A3M0G2T5_9FLAO|nr:CotH kinase family protein [Dokdonia sinensis]RMB56512.1 spore coat protein CotH [Dokdonia sinensis]